MPAWSVKSMQALFNFVRALHQACQLPFLLQLNHINLRYTRVQFKNVVLYKFFRIFVSKNENG